MYTFKRIFEYARCFFLVIIARIISVFVRPTRKYKDLWIVSERGTDARDNGYHFFKYLTTQHPEICCVYIISKNSPDRPKVAALGRVISYGSLEHYLSFLLAKVRVSSHIEGYSPDILFFNKFGKFVPSKAKNIFLQHGIIKDDIEFCHADRTNIDMFVCSATPEYDYIDKVYGYEKGILKLTGLCRYDNLRKNDTTTRKILFMPTWRASLRSCSQRTFCASEYFKKYNSLLNSSRLSELLKKYDYELVFYPHYEVQKFLGCFGTDNERVRIADFKNNDVQQLLIDSDILITDYSSVYFDYAYMRKPMVFYQYDEEAFRAQQYGKGYFDYKRDGFGKVVQNESEVIEELESILKNDLQPTAEYLQKMNSFFKFNDANNCERTYKAILNLL